MDGAFIMAGVVVVVIILVYGMVWTLLLLEGLIQCLLRPIGTSSLGAGWPKVSRCWVGGVLCFQRGVALSRWWCVGLRLLIYQLATQSLSRPVTYTHSAPPHLYQPHLLPPAYPSIQHLSNTSGNRLFNNLSHIPSSSIPPTFPPPAALGPA